MAALQELEQNPITPRSNTIKKMKGYTNVYCYRIGDFRSAVCGGAGSAHDSTIGDWFARD